MKKVLNPFLTTGYRGPEYFCDREYETDRLSGLLESGNNVTLISPRRLGRSALIQHTFNRLKANDEDCRCFYIDILATKSTEDLVQALSKAIVGKLDKLSDKAIHAALDFFKAFRPIVSVDSLTGSPEFSFDLSPNQVRQSLESILDYVDNSEKRCYIAIDEFQQITEYEDKGVEALLRSKIQFMKNTNFIFSGSQMHLMSEMFISPKRPFFSSTDIMTLKEIDENKYHDFANHFFNSQHRSISADDFHYLYSKVDGQTWYVQKLLSNIYYQSSQAINHDLVDECIVDAVNEQEPTFLYIYQSLSVNQAALLKAIAREGNVESPYSKEFMNKYHLAPQSSISRSLNAIVSKQLVYHDLQRKQYTVYDRFMAMWLRK